MNYDRSVVSQALPPLLILDPGNFTPRYDLNLGAALSARGWHPLWVTSRHQFDEIPAPACLTVRTPFFKLLPLRGFLGKAPALRRVAKVLSYPGDLVSFSSSLASMRPGIIHVQWALLPMLDSICWRKWKKQGWTIVYTVHDPLPLSGTTPLSLAWGSSRLCSVADAVIVHGREGARILEQAGVSPCQIRVLPPGPPVAGSPTPRDKARAMLGVPSAIPTVLFFGYIKPYKGLHTLLGSLPEVRKSVGEILLIVAGECMESRRHYSKLISELKLQQEVRWFDGYVPEAAMPLYFSAADVVVLPYLSASSSGVLLCAYMFERPVVASAVGGNRELVEDGRTGMLVAPGDPKALASALTRLLTNPALASMMAARGREMAERLYSWDLIGQQTEELYLHLWRERG